MTTPAATEDRSHPASQLPPPSLLETARSYLVPLAMLALFGWFAFSCFATIQRILHYYNPLPYWDYWRIAQNLARYQSFDLRPFWRQHNDHRIIFPEIVFALDMLLLHGRMILPLAVSFLCYFATWTLLSSTVFADRQLSRTAAITGALLAGVIAFWHGSAALLAAPFQLQWTLLQLAVSCSLVWLSKLEQSSRSLYLAGVIAAAVVANYSSGNGLLLWPLLLAISFAVHLPRRYVIVLAVAASAFVGLYFVGYQFGSELNIRNLVTHPWYLLEYFGSYLSMPFGGMKTPQFGVWVGLSNLFLTIGLFAVAWRRGLLNTQPAMVLFGSYAFTLLTILLTAAGRMDPDDVTFSGAKPPRYITVPLMNWAVFILLSFWISARTRWKLVSPLVLASVFSLLLLIYLPQLRDWLALITEDYAEEQLSALAMENDVFDSNLLHKLFISPEFIMQWVPELRQQHLSIYFKGHDRWLGRPLSQFSAQLNTPIPGQISSAFPVAGGVQITGWADGSTARRSYDWVVLVDQQRQIVGFGRRIPAGFPSILVLPNTPPSISWVGFVNLSSSPASVSAYAVDARHGGLLPLESSMPLPTVRRASLSQTAGAVPGVVWQKDAIWTKNTLPEHVEYGEIPPGVNYASWSGDDANRGQIASSAFDAPANGCLIMPVLHGPKHGGLSVELQDADTNQPLATAPIQDNDTRWEYWRATIPAQTHRVRVVARDEGKDWGEWLAIAAPAKCR